MTLDIEAIRSQFPALGDTDDGLARIYFDNPAGTQVPQSVVDAMAHCMLTASANLGGHFRTSVMAEDIVADAQQAMADFLNAPSADEIVFGQNMTSLTFHISRSIGRRLHPGDEIILSRMDHDANVQPWVLMARDCGLNVRWLPFDTETFEFDLQQLERLLSERTRLVCVCAASNLTGTINDVRSICRIVRDAAAWTDRRLYPRIPSAGRHRQGAGGGQYLCVERSQLRGRSREVPRHLRFGRRGPGGTGALQYDRGNRSPSRIIAVHPRLSGRLYLQDAPRASGATTSTKGE